MNDPATEAVADPPRREVVRVLVINESDRVLLIKEYFGTVGDPNAPAYDGPIWLLPGGGVEPGESPECAAIRELWEETGISNAELGPWIWTREKLLMINGRELLMDERYYRARVSHATFSRANLTSAEQETVQECRWWSLEELAASDEMIAPRGLPGFLAPILDGQIPREPVVLST
jgi:8-oxo-dGTP pyrophosphatase MutT (NUDIX family)